MNPKKQKLTKSDLSNFFSSCLRPPGPLPKAKSPEPKPLSSVPGVMLPAKLAIPAGFRPACQDTSSRTFRTKATPPVSPTIFKVPVALASPVRLSTRHPSLQTKRRGSTACLNSHVELLPPPGASRKSLKPAPGSVKDKRSFSKDGGPSRAYLKQPPPIVLQQSPAHLINIRHLGISGIRPNQPKGKTDLSTKRGPVRTALGVTRVQTSKEFRDNFREFQATHKPSASKANFENYVQRKSGILQNRVSSGLPKEQLEVTQDKVARLDKLVELAIALDPPTQDAGTSKAFRRFYDVNFLNSNMTDLLKDLAKQEALEKPSKAVPRVGPSSDGPLEASLKHGLIKENLKMMREHLFFEDFLQLLAEKGVDIENLFSFCNQRLKIRAPEDQPTARHPPDSSDASVSEVSLLDLDRLRHGATTARGLTMDFTGLRGYSTSGSDRED